MKKIIFIIFPLLLGAGIYDYLKIPVSSKESALFNIYGLFGNEPSALFVNPSRIFEMGKFVEAGYGNYILDIHQGYIIFPLFKREKPFLGTGLHFFHFGKFTKTDTFGLNRGDYTAQSIALNLYFSILKNNGLAGSFEIYYNTLDKYNSLAIATSIGWDFYTKQNFLKEGLWKNSLILRYLGFEIKPFKGERADLPLTLAFLSGLKFKTFETGLSLIYTLNSGFDFQFSYLYHWGKYMSVSFGYTSAYRDVNIEENLRNLFAGFCGGIGINVKKVKLFYSYTPFGVLGDIHRIDISYTF